ncbi:hypothetical protein HY404_04230 [Candidatus Microgenomates bacterium]|nr:hypothetical protein [Candidatus Microgenomates bacterium]
MGKTKTAFIGETSAEEQQKEAKIRAKKIAAKKEKGIRVPGLKGGERVVAVGGEVISASETTENKTEDKAVKIHKRGKKYLQSRMLVDPTKTYPVRDAVELAQKSSYSRFPGQLELHMNVVKKGRYEINLPHSTGTTKKVEIANDETIAKLEKGVVDFDVLISSPTFLPKLVPFARLLGPKGLMPNPKNGTLTDNTQAAAEKFSGNTLILQTEKDVPVIHTVVGKISDAPNDLSDNVKAVLAGLGERAIQKAILKATMGPAVKIAI